jgi:hypothetical protein
MPHSKKNRNAACPAAMRRVLMYVHASSKRECFAYLFFSLKNPHDSRMAPEIKNLDDEIAECTEHMDHLNKAKQR